MSKLRMLALVVAVISMLVAAVVVPGAASNSQQKTIGFTVWNLQALFFNQQLAGIRQAAKDYNVKIIAIDCHNKPAEQVSSIEDLVQEGVNAIIVNPVDAFGVIPAMKDAVKAGIPCIAIDQKIQIPPASMFIGVDNYKAGVEIGNFFVKYVKEHWANKSVVKVGIGGALNAYIQNLRLAGFMEAIKGAPQIHVVQIVDGQNVLDVAMTAVENMLSANPDLDAIYTTGEPQTVGAVAAVESAGKTDKIKIVGWDLQKQVIDGIDKGFVVGIVQQDPYQEGYQGVAYALKILNGEKVPKTVLIPITIVTKDNVDQFRDLFSGK